MKSVRHICQGGTAAELVRGVVGPEVVEISDDGAIGPLADMDLLTPDARISFWTEILSLDEDGPRIDIRSELGAIRHELAELAAGATEVIIWAGSHPTEQALRRRVHWWLRDSPVSVTEVTVGTEDSANIPVAVVSLERLRSRFDQRSLSTAADRRRLADEWAVLRNIGCGVRVWKRGSLSERPIDHYDVRLLSLASVEPIGFPRLLGRAMAETGRSDTFCRWRLATLVRAGLLSSTSREWRLASVRLAKKRGRQ